MRGLSWNQQNMEWINAGDYMDQYHALYSLNKINNNVLQLNILYYIGWIIVTWYAKEDDWDQHRRSEY